MRTQTTFTFEACVTEMPLSSGGDMSVSISPPCLCTRRGEVERRGRRSGCCVCVPCCTPPPPPARLWGRGWKMKWGCEDTGGRGSGRIVDRRGRGPSDFFLLTHTQTHTHTHTLVAVRAAVVDLSQVHRYLSIRRHGGAECRSRTAPTPPAVWEAHRSGLNLFKLGSVLGKKRS